MDQGCGELREEGVGEAGVGVPRLRDTRIAHAKVAKDGKESGDV